MRIEVTNFKRFELFKVGNTQVNLWSSALISVYVSECKQFHFKSLMMIWLYAEHVKSGISHDKDKNSSENQKCFNRLWFIIMLWKHLSIIWRSFKTQSLISSLATTQIFYSHYNTVYSTIENQSQKKLAIKVLKQNKQGFTRYH